jgi:hypothetical protein
VLAIVPVGALRIGLFPLQTDINGAQAVLAKTQAKRLVEMAKG